MALHMCAGCQAISHLRKCEACGLARYCGRDCQRAHWKSHREACRAVVSAKGDGRPNREENKKVVSAIVKALPNALRAASNRRDQVHIIVYRGPANVPFDLTKALSGEVPNGYLSVRLVDLEVADAFFWSNSLASLNSANRSAWRSGTGKVVVASGIDGLAITFASCVTLRYPSSV